MTFVSRPIFKENQVVEAERGNVGIILKRDPCKFPKLKKGEVRRRFDEMAQRRKHFPVRDQAVLNTVGDGKTVRLDISVHGLFFPAGSAVKGQPHQSQNQQHGHDDLSAPFRPELIGPIEKTKGERRKNHHAQSIADIPVPPGKESFRRFNDTEQTQSAYADRGGNQAGRQRPPQEKTKQILLALQTSPGLTHQAPNQERPGPGLRCRADGDHRRHGRRLRSERAVEPGMRKIQEKRSQPDGRQHAKTEQKRAGQREARGGKHGACVAGRNGQREADGPQRDIGQANKKHSAYGKGAPGCWCQTAAVF